MRDPDLVFRAQLAATSLEGAWNRWRVAHALTTDPMPTVSSYVGYSHDEPWGQPRVVFGLAAGDAEQLAAVLERHDREGHAYVGVPAQSATREVLPAVLDRYAASPVPEQLPSTIAERRGSDRNPGYDEPLYRQAAAAMHEAAAVQEAAAMSEAAAAAAAEEVSARQIANRAGTDDQAALAPAARDQDARDPDTSGGAAIVHVAENSGQPVEPATAASVVPASEAVAPVEPATAPSVVPASETVAAAELDTAPTDAPATAVGTATGTAEVSGSDAASWAGSLARAASAARAEAEARIKATQTDASGGRSAGRASSAATGGGPAAMPHVYATDVLEPLPAPETAASDHASSDDAVPDDAVPDDAVPDDAVPDDAVPDVSGPVPESDQEHGRDDEQDKPMATESEESAPTTTRRSRVPRSYSMPRIARTKRPPAVPDAP